MTRAGRDRLEREKGGSQPGVDNSLVLALKVLQGKLQIVHLAGGGGDNEEGGNIGAVSPGGVRRVEKGDLQAVADEPHAPSTGC